MSNQNLHESVAALTALITELKFEEALQTFYDDSIVTFENGATSTEGPEAYMKAGKTFFENISNYNAQLLHVITGKDLSACHWHYTFDHKQWGHWDKEQISVQSWKDGKIVREIHFYN